MVEKKKSDIKIRRWISLIKNSKACDLKMDSKTEYLSWVSMSTCGTPRHILAFVYTQTCYRSLMTALARLVLTCDGHIKKQHAVATSNPAMSRILLHANGNTVSAQMRHSGMPSSNNNSKTKRPASQGMAISASMT